MPARDYCFRRPVTVEPRTTVRDAVRSMEKERVGCVVVTEEGRPVGMLTDRDAALSVLTRRLDPRAARVSDVMAQPVQTVDADAPLTWALSLLRTGRIRRLPVVDEGGALVGLLALDDLLRLLATEVGDVAEAIRRQLSRPTGALSPKEGSS
jgi:CBS domain-containing protein